MLVAKKIFVIFFFVFLFNCGAQIDSSSENDEITSTESALCREGTPPGRCPAIGFYRNKQQEKNTSGRFLQCGLGCLANYHPEEYSFAASCRSGVYPTIDNNQTLCVKNSSFFVQCGLSCPSGYSLIEQSYSPSCKRGGATILANNQSSCRIK